jgi:hypothetical protein
MSLNNIELPDFVLTELYRNSLIATDTPAIAADTTPKAVGIPPVAAIPPAVAADKPVAADKQVPAKKDSPGAAGIHTAASPGASSPYKFLGDNRKNITIVVQSPGVAFLPDHQLAFLTKMLEACRMNIGDTAIVNHAVTPVAIDALKQQLKPSVVLLFGMQPVIIKLPVDFPQFNIQDYDQCTYLYSSSLDELVREGAESKILKSKLWVCLKTLFGV